MVSFERPELALTLIHTSHAHPHMHMRAHIPTHPHMHMRARTHAYAHIARTPTHAHVRTHASPRTHTHTHTQSLPHIYLPHLLLTHTHTHTHTGLDDPQIIAMLRDPLESMKQEWESSGSSTDMANFTYIVEGRARDPIPEHMKEKLENNELEKTFYPCEN